MEKPTNGIMDRWKVIDALGHIGKVKNEPLRIQGEVVFVEAPNGYRARLEACRLIQSKLGQCIDPTGLTVELAPAKPEEPPSPAAPPPPPPPAPAPKVEAPSKTKARARR